MLRPQRGGAAGVAASDVSSQALAAPQTVAEPQTVIAPQAVTAPQSAATPRVVAIGGAATQIAYALDAGDLLVGASQSAVPAHVQAQAAQNPAKVAYVRSVSSEGILALGPTLILAGSDVGPKNAVDQLQASGVPLLIMPAIESPEDLYAAIRAVAGAVDRAGQAEALIADIQATFAAVRQPERSPSVLFLIKSPSSKQLMAAGSETRAESLIRMAGGHNALTSFSGYKALSPEALVALQPDVLIVAAPEAFERLGTAGEVVQGLKKHLLWGALKAARTDNVYAVGLGETLTFGPSVADVVLRMNEIFLRAGAAE